MRKYEEEARKNWDVFYKTHEERFFKDRHYLAREFPHVFPDGLASGGGGPEEAEEAEDFDGDADASAVGCENVVHLPNEAEHEVGPAPRYAYEPRATSSATDDARAALSGRDDDAFPGRVFLEVGCGAGNTAFPLLAVDPTATVFCCDFSERAVDLVRRRVATLPAEQRSRVRPFVCDVSREPLADVVPVGAVDVCTMVFVLSAISPDRFADTLRNISSVMRADRRGRVLVRDYAEGDLAQIRFERDGLDGRKLGENFYVRGDGTRAYYFAPKTLKELFDARGMALEVMDVHQRAITNRSRGVRMLRRWVQASFASAPRPEAPLPPPPPPPEPAWARRKREADARKAEEEKAKEREAEEARRRELAEAARAREAVAACDREGLERALLRLMREGRVGADELAELSARESSEAS